MPDTSDTDALSSALTCHIVLMMRAVEWNEAAENASSLHALM
jgi:hypothetical protein